MLGFGSRNLVRVPISSTALAPTFIEGRTVSVKTIRGLPVDARYVGATVDPTNATAYFIFHHDSFPAHFEGAQIPIMLLEHEVKVVNHGIHRQR